MSTGRGQYITDAGYRALREELDNLFRVERPRVVKGVADAAAEGDRSENAEYIYGKKKLAEIDRRLTFLGKRLDVLKIVDTPPDNDGRVYFGAWVTLEDEDGQQAKYRIVGSDESDPEKKHISMDSPLAQALLRKQIGDEITVQRPKGEITYEIIAVRYGSGS